jgi:hypothetical protein
MAVTWFIKTSVVEPKSLHQTGVHINRLIDRSSGAGFSLRGLVHARTKPRKLPFEMLRVKSPRPFFPSHHIKRTYNWKLLARILEAIPNRSFHAFYDGTLHENETG